MGLQPTAFGGPNSAQGRRKWQPTPVFLPGKSYGQRSLVGYYHEVANSRTRQNTHITPTQAVSEGVGEFLVTIDMQETTPKLSGIKQSLQDFPAVVEKGHQSDPWSRRIPHALGQLSPRATATEARALETVLCNKRSPLTPTLEQRHLLQKRKPVHRNKGPAQPE